MFNLEEAISQWRQQMAGGGLMSFEALDELEEHLRDDFARRQATSQDPAEAFTAALEQLGSTTVLNAEYQKINSDHPMKPIVKILFGLGILLTGASVVLPALAKMQEHFGIPMELIWGLMGGTVVATSGICILLHALVFRKIKALA